MTARGPAAQGRCISLLPAVSAVSALFIAAAVSSHRRKGPVFSPHLGRTRGVRPPFLPGGIVCPAPKKETPAGVSFFVIAHRFCCLHSRTSQGRGSVRGEPLTGSPTRVQSPARRRPLLRSKSAAPKRKHHPSGWCFLFGAGYGSRTRLNGLGSRCNTDIPTLRFTYRVIVAYRRRFCNRKLCRKGMNVLSRRIPIEKSLEGTL